MGQYYMPTLIDDNGTISTLYSHDYDNGLKLMEHSYIGNDFVNAVLTQLWKHPQRLAWIGDYSDSFYGDPYETKLPHSEFMKYYDAAWRDEEGRYQIHPAYQPIITLRHKKRYLVNHTQRSYIHIGEYIAANKYKRKGLYRRGKYDSSHTYNMCFHPLPLLTACGNGRGFGDYHEECPSYDKIGTWAFDRIEVTDKRPADYEKMAYNFTKKNMSSNGVVGM